MYSTAGVADGSGLGGGGVLLSSSVELENGGPVKQVQLGGKL